MRKAIYPGVGNGLFNQEPVLWLQKNILGSRWQESKTSQALLQCCVLCVHLPLPALAFTATTHHVSHQKTLLPVPLTAHGTSWVTAVGTRTAMLSTLPTQPRSGGNTAGLLHGGGLLIRGAQPTNSTCLARMMTQACTSPRHSPYSKLYIERRLQKDHVSIFSPCLCLYCSLHRHSAPMCQSDTLGSICLAVQGQPVCNLLGQGP